MDNTIVYVGRSGGRDYVIVDRAACEGLEELGWERCSATPQPGAEEYVHGADDTQ